MVTKADLSFVQTILYVFVNDSFELVTIVKNVIQSILCMHKLMVLRLIFQLNKADIRSILCQFTHIKTDYLSRLITIIF